MAQSAECSRVVDVALTHFARDGFDTTKLDSISRDSGMSKRMIHYHFGDKRGLYEHAVREAITCLQPQDDQVDDFTDVPVEGIVRLINTVCDQFLAHPAAITLLIREGMERVLNLPEMPQLVTSAPVRLQLDRLLIIGQDSGAFRPGISADDILILVTSLAFYRIAAADLSINMVDIDFETDENIAGIRRLTIDAVLAFLTANIPDSGRDSYIEMSSPDLYDA